MSILEPTEKKQRPQHERLEKTRTLVFQEPSVACRDLAQEVARLIRERQGVGGNVVLGLATGSTPVPFYRELIRLHKEEDLSFENAITFNLDEYYGLPQGHPESYYRFMRDQLFDHVNVPEENINIPDGTVSMDEVYESCFAYEQKIADAGGLDLQILGIGRTGHIGFNEPGSSKDSITRMITLDRVTRQDAAADFMGMANVPRSAITMGVGTILDAKRIVLMAWGSNKADIVQEAVEGPETDRVSASFLQGHEAATFLIDEAASARLTRFRHPWLVGSVNWEQSMTKRAVVWLSQKLDKPILKLVDEDYNETGAGEMLASTSAQAYQVNIDVFNDVQNTITGWPGGKPGTENENRPERADPAKKNVLILSPEPSDAFIGMGGTIDRLVNQGHRVSLLCQTSGNLRVADAAARNFASVVQEMADTQIVSGWENQAKYADEILEKMDAKGEFGVDSDVVRTLKGLILRGEARDAAEVCELDDRGRHDEQCGTLDVIFADLPFYELGRFRRFHLTKYDVTKMITLIKNLKPDSVFATGDASDPSSAQALCFVAFREAWEKIYGRNGSIDTCNVWLYRGRDQALETHEIEMAVPMSPDQLAKKGEAIRKFQSLGSEDLVAPKRNQRIATAYDQLGMANYEAIEAFRKWEGQVGKQLKI